MPGAPRSLCGIFKHRFPIKNEKISGTERSCVTLRFLSLFQESRVIFHWANTGKICAGKTSLQCESRRPILLVDFTLFVVMRFTMRSASFTWANSSEHTCESRVLPTQYTQIFLWTCVQAVSFTLIGIQWLDRHIWPPCGSLNSYCLCSAPRTQADVTLGAVAVSMHLYRRAAPKWMQKRGPAHRMGVKARVNEPLGVIYTCAGLWKAFHVGFYSKSGTGAADWHSGSDTAVSLLPNRLL